MSATKNKKQKNGKQGEKEDLPVGAASCSGPLQRGPLNQIRGVMGLKNYVKESGLVEVVHRDRAVKVWNWVLVVVSRIRWPSDEFQQGTFEHFVKLLANPLFANFHLDPRIADFT